MGKLIVLLLFVASAIVWDLTYCPEHTSSRPNTSRNGWSIQPKQFPVTIKEPIISDVLKPYLDDFAKDAAKFNVDIKINRLGFLVIADLTPESHHKTQRMTAGICLGVRTQRFEDLERTQIVYISDRFSPEVTGQCLYKKLVYHELGHCLLGRHHDPKGSGTIMQDGGFFNPLHKDAMEIYCRKNWDYLVTDLFTRDHNTEPQQFREHRK